MSRRDPLAYILGVGQMPARPRYPDITYAELLAEVTGRALADAGLEPSALDGIVLSSAPDLLLGFNEPHYLALAGLPRTARFLGRVNTAAGSGIGAFRLACAHVASGRAKRVLVVAADLGAQTLDHQKLIWTGLDALRERHAPMNGISLFAFMASLYMHLYKVPETDLSLVTLKNRLNGANNEFAQLRSAITMEEIAASPLVAWPIRGAHVGPAGGGAAAIVIARAREGRDDIAVRGLGSCAAVYSIGDRVSRDAPSFGYAPEMTKAARLAYDMAGIENPEAEIEAAEVYASYPIGEIVSVEALGLCATGTATRHLREGRFDRDGVVPVNASGGATCGNPLSTTALARVAELARQLRGERRVRSGSVPSAGVANGFGGVTQLHDVVVLGCS